MKIFLGGTCVGHDYRDEVIPYLVENYVSFFNPVVDDWTEELKVIEDLAKEECNTHMYVITSAMKGVYSIAEIIDAVYRGKNCIIYFDLEGFDEGQVKSFKAIEDLIMRIPTGNAYILANLLELPLALEELQEKGV